ncbi:MAG: hypothetical protein SA398_18510 [Methanosarcina sp.]|nr:hypothetical protein [Methanosarcina sp.]
MSNRTLLCRNEFETRIMKFRFKRLMAGLKPDILIYHLNLTVSWLIVRE